jgi:hypothetical protein
MGTNYLTFEQYNVEQDFFGPVGDWYCTIRKEYELDTIRRDFYLARASDGVHIDIYAFPEFDSVEIDAGPSPRRGEVSHDLVQISGSVEGVGGASGESTVILSGEFEHDAALALDVAEVRVDALLTDVEDDAEFVAGLPLILSAQPGSTADVATYATSAGGGPQAQLHLTTAGTFDLTIENATIAALPQCADGSRTTFPLALRITVDDHVGPPLILDGGVEWECLGGSQPPMSLEAVQLLSPEATAPEAAPIRTPVPTATGTDTPPATVEQVSETSAGGDGCQIGSRSATQTSLVPLLPLLLLLWRRRGSR